MKILGIETSCDETSASILEDGVNILSNVVASSQQMHVKTGGIIPEQAAREQIKSIIPVIQEAISQAKINPQELDAIAVTVGPGLIGSLLVGIEAAKTLSFAWNKPIIPVNHLLAHIYANWLNSVPSFPLIALVVSGGHTELIYMKGHGDYSWLGGTRDDASGEAFDKIARLLELGYPGGPAISVAADKFINHNSELQIKLPRPMIDSHDFDFSFSGLKTAVLREVNKLKSSEQFNKEKINYLAYEVQESITDVLIEKVLKACYEKNVRSLVLAGGVAANSRLREKLSLKINFLVPPPSLCTDNAAAIAACAFFNNSPSPWQEIQAFPSLDL